MATSKPFKINVPDADLEVLRQKLELTRLGDQPDGYTVKQGVTIPEMSRVIEHWKTTFLPNWRKHEAKLNELPMFTRDVETDGFGKLNIHFIHKISERKDAIPLLFVHGWPGSFIEATRLLEPLANPPEGKQAFHVVAPSLPNYGFSEGVKKRGFNLRHYGFVMNQLMLDLGYNEYVAQGGDWGSMITRIMGRYHEKNLKAVHVNLAAFVPGNVLKQPWLLPLMFVPGWWPTKLEKQGLANAQNYQDDGNAYYKTHQTRPLTIAYALNDSPVALVGWIYEKLIHWTDSYPWTHDELLVWISIYWFSRAGPGASVRTYFEATDPDPQYKAEPKATAFFDWTNVLLGVSQFPKDIVSIPAALLRTLGRIGFERYHTSGGHFAAYEKPEELAGDIRDFFGPGGGAYGLVKQSKL